MHLHRMHFCAILSTPLEHILAYLKISIFASKDHKEYTLRKYELMMIFPLEEELSKNGLEAVRETLAQFGTEIESEEPYGDRDLCYDVKKRNRGRFLLFNIKVNPAKVVDIDRQFKLHVNLLKFMFVRVDE